MREERTRIRLTHELPDATSNHVLGNSGEDLWRLTRDDGRRRVAVAGIDYADHRFEVVVRSSVLKRSVRFIEEVLSKHLVRDKVRVDVLEEP